MSTATCLQHSVRYISAVFIITQWRHHLMNFNVSTIILYTPRTWPWWCPVNQPTNTEQKEFNHNLLPCTSKYSQIYLCSNVHRVFKNIPVLFFWITLAKKSNFNDFWYTSSLGNWTPEGSDDNKDLRYKNQTRTYSARTRTRTRTLLTGTRTRTTSACSHIHQGP